MMRTDQQRKSIEVYCRNVAEALNEANYNLEAVLKAKAIPVSCTQENIKDTVFKAVSMALYPVDAKGKPLISTTQLEPSWVSEVYEHMNRWLASEFPEASHVPFPSREGFITFEDD